MFRSLHRALRAGLIASLAIAPAGLGAQQLQLRVVDNDLHRFSPAEITLIDSSARSAIAEVRALLPELPDSITLEIEAAPEDQILPETGDGGVAIAPGVIRWTVNPGRSGGVAAVVRQAMRGTLFHELHHLARRWTVRGGLPINSLMDAVVAEGLATAFARDFAGFKASYAVVPPEPDAWVAELRARSPAALADYLTWMIQHPDGRYRIGYRAGTYLVDRAVTRSGRSLLSLTTLPAADIIALAVSDNPALRLN